MPNSIAGSAIPTPTPTPTSSQLNLTSTCALGVNQFCGVPFYPITNESHKDEIPISIGP